MTIKRKIIILEKNVGVVWLSNTGKTSVGLCKVDISRTGKESPKRSLFRPGKE